MKRINTINIKWQGLFGKIGGLKTDAYNRICIEREVIPIIFVPGIMGSRLCRRQDKARIWDPDDGKFMVKKYGWKTVTAAERRAMIIGTDFSASYAEVDRNNAKHNSKFACETDRNRDRRGWGGVMWGSYGPFLVKLQQHQWPEPLDKCFEFPVHAFGYNWTASNDDSGALLARYIEQTIGGYRNGIHNSYGRKRDCDKVILVTHSMGGLVARSACVLHGAGDNVIGVIHGVQPAAGSPAAYWRMKAGFERPRGGPQKEWWDWWRNPLKMSKHHLMGHISAAILGTNGEEVTSLLGNSPGGLELLPTREYRDNAGNVAWLEYPAAKGKIHLPVSDPYREIYLLKDVAYRMVDPSWLNPGYKKLMGKKGPWELYSGYLGKAKSFHECLNKDSTACFHPESYQFYGTDLDSPDRVEFSRKNLSAEVDCRTGGEMKFYNKGCFKTYVNSWECVTADRAQAVGIVTLSSPTGKGDGTVPVSSASFLPVGKGRTVKISTSEGSWFDIGHQDILGTASAQRIVFSYVRNLMLKYIKTQVG